jgi:hypothetical protein
MAKSKMIFSRKKNSKLISVILPSRKRLALLQKTLDSIYSLADPKNDNFEVIIKFDLDDIASIDFIKSWNSKRKGITFVINDRGMGWLNMVDFVEDMIDLAKGKWILNVNDDMEFLTQNWNTLLEKHLVNFKFYAPYVNQYHFAFPVYPKEIKQILGRLAPHNQIDAYLFALFSKLDRVERIDKVRFYHDVHLKDTTAMEKIGLWDLNYDTKDYHYSSPEFNSDLEKLKQYINELC